jgi:protein phosphatase
VLKGDRYLICSDGLSGVVSAETIGESMREIGDPQACVERLVQLALRGGGPDNITVVIADATDADIVEQAPIVGGAAARDRGNSTVADSSSAAARAAALQAPPRPAQPEGAGAYEREEPEPRRHPVRTGLLALLLLAVLGGGLYLAYQYTQKQYYVGATDAGQLAIFRGVPGEIAGLDLSSVNETSPARLDDLTTVAQDRVKQGIQADSRPDAQRRLAELTSAEPSNPNLKPICSPARPEPSAGVSAEPSVQPTTAGLTSAPRRTNASSAPATEPATTPDAPPSDLAPPVIDPVGCRPVD